MEGEHVEPGVRDRRAGPPAHVTEEFEACIGLFEDELDIVYQGLRRHGLGAADAEDIVQEVFLVMWRRWAEYDHRRPLRAWLSGIAFRVAYRHRGRRGREVPGGLIDMTDEQPTPEEQAFATSGRALVLRLLAALSERERTIVRLHEVEGVPMRDIAETLAIPLQTAHTRLRNGRRNFDRLLRRTLTVADAKAALAAPAPPAAHQLTRSIDW
jgi:RNA polymerase sigma-70 factor (ECF subfamily)